MRQYYPAFGAILDFCATKLHWQIEFAPKAEVVRHIVREKIRPTEAELAELHDGNIARFRLRPSEFKQWKEG